MTPDKVNKLIKRLRRANFTLADACRAAQLNPSTVYRWADGKMVPTEHKWMDFKRVVEEMIDAEVPR